MQLSNYIASPNLASPLAQELYITMLTKVLFDGKHELCKNSRYPVYVKALCTIDFVTQSYKRFDE